MLEYPLVDVSLLCKGIRARYCVKIICIVDIGKKAHRESYMSSRSKFTPATSDRCKACPKFNTTKFREFRRLMLQGFSFFQILGEEQICRSERKFQTWHLVVA